MFSRAVSKLNGATLFLGLAIVALPSFAQTPAGIKISDNSGNIITVSSTGAVAYSGACTPATCTTVFSTGILSNLGEVSWSGSIGVFSFTATGESAPLRPGIQDINLSSVFTGGTGGTVTVLFTTTGVDGGAPYTLNQSTNFTLGTGSVTYTSYADATDTPYGTGTTLASIGPVTSSGSSNLVSLPGPDSHSLSITDQVVLTLGPGAFFSTDFYTQNSSNAPLLVSCAPGAAVACIAYSGSLMASGGVPSFVYSITGSLPPGLALNSSTGAITGTPSAQGSYSYTAEVTDSSGSGSSHSVTEGCSITVAPPATPLGLKCSAATGLVGTAYTSTLVASGGTGLGYMYSIASGSLPAGLALNATTGFITGTPTSAGASSFVAQVKDTGDSTEALASASCGIAISSATGSPLASGDTATIGFWHNKNGQALILALNGGSNSTSLANWLAAQFPYLYGSHSSNDLTGKTNSSVAALFLTFFSGAKTNAQIMAGALAAYVTSSSLAGTTASQYGFNSSTAGTGAKTYNVGSDGSGIGLVSNQSYAVLQLLQQANLTTGNGTFNANAFNDVFNGINTTGDIN